MSDGGSLSIVCVPMVLPGVVSLARHSCTLLELPWPSGTHTTPGSPLRWVLWTDLSVVPSPLKSMLSSGQTESSASVQAVPNGHKELCWAAGAAKRISLALCFQPVPDELHHKSSSAGPRARCCTQVPGNRQMEAEILRAAPTGGAGPPPFPGAAATFPEDGL